MLVEGKKMDFEPPSDLLEKMDQMVELIGFKDRKQLIASSVRRFLDSFITI